MSYHNISSIDIDIHSMQERQKRQNFLFLFCILKIKTLLLEAIRKTMSELCSTIHVPQMCCIQHRAVCTYVKWKWKRNRTHILFVAIKCFVWQLIYNKNVKKNLKKKKNKIDLIVPALVLIAYNLKKNSNSFHFMRGIMTIKLAFSLASMYNRCLYICMWICLYL